MRQHLTLIATIFLLAGPFGCASTAYIGESDAGLLSSTDAGTWLPGDEVCNGLDDNQDGVVDEACFCAKDAVEPCFSGLPPHAGRGACIMGAHACVTKNYGELGESKWGECVGSGTSTDEKCDGIDNDCDGTIDNGCGCPQGDNRTCTGGCGTGTQKCVNGKWGACSAESQLEVCDGKDNNCNGQIDEVVTCSGQNLSCIDHSCCVPNGEIAGTYNPETLPHTYCATQKVEWQGLEVGKIITATSTDVYAGLVSDAKRCCSQKSKVISRAPGCGQQSLGETEQRWEIRCVQ